MKYLHATSMVADWLLALPRGDQAWQSHLNGVLPKYSNTKSFDMVAVTSCKWTPVCGSTWDSTTDGGGCELPLHLNVNWNVKGKKIERKSKNEIKRNYDLSVSCFEYSTNNDMFFFSSRCPRWLLVVLYVAFYFAFSVPCFFFLSCSFVDFLSA